ncbi:GDSL-type esterase/lipase family protein [Okeania sp. SIO2C2]|uniref:SGNH/GDSL hydrolase family protein n=1 Tax=Okeania sp. SIO2C2 TaxID=2607787 RepID=UPI0025807821|nr:GDSL-type esterase/lipase family protein [Okeania sp. SIO2C2]
MVSVGLNFLFFNRSRKFYLQLNSLQLNPLAIKFYPMDTNPKEIKNPNQKNVVFFGESRARGWNSPKDFDDFNFINRGISGQTTAQVLGRLNQHIKPLSADIIIVQIGVNDLYRIPIFPDNKETIIYDCKSNIKEIVSQSRQLGAVVIMTTIFPIAEVPLERKFFWSPDIVVKGIKEVNDFIYSLENEDVIIFDTKAILANEQGKVREEYSRDFLHLNRAGYKALNDKLMPILQEL